MARKEIKTTKQKGKQKKKNAMKEQNSVCRFCKLPQLARHKERKSRKCSSYEHVQITIQLKKTP